MSCNTLQHAAHSFILFTTLLKFKHFSWCWLNSMIVAQVCLKTGYNKRPLWNGQFYLEKRHLLDTEYGYFTNFFFPGRQNHDTAYSASTVYPDTLGLTLTNHSSCLNLTNLTSPNKWRQWEAANQRGIQDKTAHFTVVLNGDQSKSNLCNHLAV